MISEVIKKLQKLTNKKNIYFTQNARTAVKQIVSNYPNKIINLQEEGSWYTYKKLGKINYLSMKKGKINTKDIPKNSVLILNSMPGYVYKENTKKIYSECIKKNTIMINDVCGSIGMQIAKHGDYITGSFGNYKPLSAGGGGFIATNKKIKIKNEELDFHKINKAINNLKTTKRRWQNKKYQILKLIPKKQIIAHNINIIAKPTENLINKLTTKNIKTVKCPTYIRINKNAISIEIKRW